jgi:hypothetical protein
MNTLVYIYVPNEFAIGQVVFKSFSKRLAVAMVNKTVVAKTRSDIPVVCCLKCVKLTNQCEDFWMSYSPMDIYFAHTFRNVTVATLCIIHVRDVLWCYHHLWQLIILIASVFLEVMSYDMNIQRHILFGKDVCLIGRLSFVLAHPCVVQLSVIGITVYCVIGYPGCALIGCLLSFSCCRKAAGRDAVKTAIQKEYTSLGTLSWVHQLFSILYIICWFNL